MKEGEAMRCAALTYYCYLVAFVVLVPSGMFAQDVHLGVSASDEGLQNFYLAIGKYYRAPEPEIGVIREHHIPDEEIPVVFFIARRAHVEPPFILDMRRRGMSWMDISLHYGIGPEVYYVPVKELPGPPYGKAYGYYKKHPKKEWRTYRLSDDDVVNFVNLRFASEHYGCSPPEVMKLRSEGKNFVLIHEQIKGNKHGKWWKNEGKKRGKHKD